MTATGRAMELARRKLDAERIACPACRALVLRKLDADAAERKAAYDEGRWCGECVYGVVMDPPCCTQGPVQP